MISEDVKKRLDATVADNYGKYMTFAKNMNNGKDHPQDILQECLLCIYEKNDEQITKILPNLEYYIIQMIKLSNRSKTSGYQRKYNKIVIDEYADVYDILEEVIDETSYVDDTEITITYEEAEKILDANASYLVKKVFLQYVKSDLSFNKFAKKTKIPASTLFKAYVEAKEIIKAHLNKDI